MLPGCRVGSPEENLNFICKRLSLGGCSIMEMSISEAERMYRFGSFALDRRKALLYLDDAMVSLPPKVAQTLCILVENHGEVINKELLLESIWPDAFVEEGNLHHNISVLRRVLRENAGAPVRIETIPKRGYRFVGEVVTAPAEQPSAPVVASSPSIPPRRRSWNRAAGWAAALAVTLAASIVGLGGAGGNEEGGNAVPASSIAVLPFSNFSADPQADYLGDGLTDELIHALTAVPGLRVVGRTSSFQFKGKSLDLREIGRRLQARLVLEGSVQKDGGRLRITAQLLDARTGLHLWSQRFDRPFDGIFAMQDEICRAVASAIRVQVAAPGESGHVVRQAASLEVYTLYLRGLKEWNRRNRAGIIAAQEFFERALAMDGSYAPAWAGVADTLVHSGIWGIVPLNESFPKAKAAAQRAIELDGQLAAPHTVLGYIQGWHERRHEAAEASFRRALELSPSYSWGRQRLASYLSAVGRHQEAIEEYRRALEVDPISPSVASGLALTFFWARQYDRAIAQCNMARELDPQSPLTYYYLSHVLEQQRKYEESISALREGTRLWGSTDQMMLTALYAAAPGHRQEALDGLATIRSRSGGGASDPYQMALIYLALGDRKASLRWLEQSAAVGDVWFLYANVDPRLDGLRSDPRFQELLGKAASH